MMKRILLILLLLPTMLLAQERLVPLHRGYRSYAAPKQVDTVEVKLPFFDDFANYAGAPRSALWLTPHAYVNQDYAPLPPTIGMVTLDALDAQGDLYAAASASRFAADTLCSQPIRLDSVFSPTRKRLVAGDSVYLSFFYLPGGGMGDMWERTGEAPDADDSLLLEFYAPDMHEWRMVWATGGVCVDTLVARTGHAWQFVSVAIDESDYLKRGFRFRFRNYASLDPNPKPGLVGNTDQWNIDYIYLNYNRRKADKSYRDVAFVEKAPSMLQHYQAMPARQFTPDEMAQHVELTIANLYGQTLTTSYGYTVYREDGSTLSHYDGGHENAPSFFPNETYQTAGAHANPAVNFTYPVSSTQQRYMVEHVVTEGVSGDAHRNNDTIRFSQVFADYYAYDDGVAENGYGISTPGFIACRYKLNQRDTLTALDICFNETRNGENQSGRFYICVWNCVNGKPGTLIKRQSTKQTVKIDGQNRFRRYTLDEPLLVSDTVFIGIQQLDNTFLNIGFDGNNDARAYTFYKTGNAWQQTILRGAVMMRPCFGASALVNTPVVEQHEFKVYPNPTSGIIHWEGDATSVALYNSHGRRIYESTTNGYFDLGSLPKGMYILKAVYIDGRQSIHKIVLK